MDNRDLINREMRNINSIQFIALILLLTTFTFIYFKYDSAVSSEDKEVILILGNWDEEKIDYLLGKTSKINDVGGRIDFLSKQFLGVEYKESTLVGNTMTPEVLVVNLKGMDCFTYLDYVEAMQLSDSFTEFVDNLQLIRYQSGDIDYKKRNHFFTDWEVFNSSKITDVTKEVGGDKTKKVKEFLNKREDGTYYLPGIPVVERYIDYIPTTSVDKGVLDSLMTGDYIGIYSDEIGLDVSHTGMVIKNGDKVTFRHASSKEKYRKVVDEDFLTYISTKPGIVILRPR